MAGQIHSLRCNRRAAAHIKCNPSSHISVIKRHRRCTTSCGFIIHQFGVSWFCVYFVTHVPGGYQLLTAIPLLCRCFSCDHIFFFCLLQLQLQLRSWIGTLGRPECNLPKFIPAGALKRPKWRFKCKYQIECECVKGLVLMWSPGFPSKKFRS